MFAYVPSRLARVRPSVHTASHFTIGSSFETIPYSAVLFVLFRSAHCVELYAVHLSGAVKKTGYEQATALPNNSLTDAMTLCVFCSVLSFFQAGTELQGSAVVPRVIYWVIIVGDLQLLPEKELKDTPSVHVKLYSIYCELEGGCIRQLLD